MKSKRPIEEIFAELTEEQKEMVYYLVGSAIKETRQRRRWPFE